MSIGDDVLAVLPELRRENESLMVDTALISRGAAPTFDPNTGLITETGTTIYTGPCRIRQPNGTAETERLFGEQQVTASRFIACFPHGVTGIEIDDVVTITASADAELLTRRFRILSVAMGTFVLYRGYPVELVE